MREVRLRLGAAALAAWLGLAPGAAAQISPGPLSRPHAALEGSLKCTQCHGGRKEDMPATCLACHKEITWLVQQRRGLHAAERATPCASCHPDHAGREFAMVSWPGGSPERFDHEKAGWRLERSHADVRCTECHVSRYQKGQAATLAPRPGGRWTGLETACITCHEDEHRGQLDRDCAACHDAGKWTLAVRFDHERTRYPLTGAHERVTCDQCHLTPSLPLPRNAAGKPVALYRPLPHAECSACHADPHAARFGAKCATCHATASWQRIDPARFDHDRTRYPLKGKHASVTCAKCHDLAPRGGNPGFATCGACHKDAHAGTATLQGKPADCAACHGLAGFRPATYGVADHARARYALEGRHREVACKACHVTRPAGVPAASLGTAAVQLRPAAATCRACHGKDHGAQLDARADSGRCESCHVVKGWTPSTFDVVAHAATALPLDGKHRDVACADCHGPSRPGLPPLTSALLGPARVALRLERSDCASCHVDVHGGRFTTGPRAQRAGCPACHDARAFRPSTITAATHQGFAYPLEGGHRAVACVACHDELRREAPGRTLLLQRTVTTPARYEAPHAACTDCHADSPHGDQFAARADKGACDGCHSLGRFRPADRFDHDRDARFSLAGAHARVACTSCHVPSAPGRTRDLRWRPLSPKCESCHADARGPRGGQ